MTQEADKQQESQQPTRLLKPWQRWILSISGSAAFGGGVAATFITENTVGSGVLLAVGATLALIGVLGYAPLRLKVGDNEVQLFEENQELRSVLTEALSARTPAVAESILDSAAPRSEPVRQQAEVSLQQQTELYEQSVMSGMLLVGAQAMAKVENDQRFDALFRYNEHTIAVNAKYTRSNVRIKQVINEMFAVMASARDIFGIIVVVPRDADYEIGDGVLLGNSHLRIVRWSNREDDDRLRATLNQLTELPD